MYRLTPNHKAHNNAYSTITPIDAIYQCATARIHAVTSLLENLPQETITENTITAITQVSTLLLNDAKLLLEELDPIAVMLSNEA